MWVFLKSLPTAFTGFVIPATIGGIAGFLVNVLIVSGTTGAPADSANPASQEAIVYGAR